MSRILRALIALALAALVLFNAPPALAQPPCGPAVLHVYDGSQMAEAPIENTYDRGPPTNHSDVQHRRADFPPSIGPLACPANVTTYDYDTHSELGTTGTTTIHDPKVNVRVAETGAEGASLSARASRVAAKSVDNLPTVNWGQQAKHFPGHPNYIPERSTMTANPEALIQRAGTGTPVNKVPRGEAGFKERINFGDDIGTYVTPDGVSSPTSIGILHYRADGSVHIVPGRPQ